MDPLGPCQSISQALSNAQTNPGADEVLVADGTYTQSLVVSDGTLLRALDATDPKPVINNGATVAAAVAIMGTGGTVQGFEIRSGHQPVLLNGPGAVTGNDFPTTTAPTNATDVLMNTVTGTVVITGNSFTDDGADTQSGIVAMATSATNLTVQNNDFTGLQTGVWLQSGASSPLIVHNDFDGMHDTGSGVVIYQGTPEIRDNTFTAPGSGTPAGISVSDTNGAAGLTTSRNRIAGLTNGIVAGDLSTNAPLTLTMNGDVIVGSGSRGVQAANIGGDGVNVTATNVTLYDNIDADLYLQDASLTLDSSIVDDLATMFSATCTISFSRGFAVGGPPVDNCDDFQTAADPMFVGGTDYHLLAGSPMIDAGNPAAPAAGVLDIDGDPRALDATPACSGNVDRRDIGADEFAPVPATGCSPGAVPPVTQPQPKKKCKKGRKLKKGKCVKKKRKKGKR